MSAIGAVHTDGEEQVEDDVCAPDARERQIRRKCFEKEATLLDQEEVEEPEGQRRHMDEQREQRIVWAAWGRIGYDDPHA